MKIEGKVAVVSGGASGIGRAAVLALVERGAKVVVADVDEVGGRQTVELAGKKGGIARFCCCDVTKSEDLGSAFASAVEHFGRFDIAFNNAGIGGEDLFADDPGDWAHVIDIDLTAVIDATRLAVRAMRRAGNPGVMVNTASLIGLGPMPSAPVYAAAKAGVVNFSRSLAHLAVESNIRVNAICPEIVDTPMALDLGEELLEKLRLAGGILQPEDIAAGVVELIEDDSRFGAVMKVTILGGRDALAAERRRLPMVQIDKDYVFEGPNGKTSLLDLFEGRRQLIVYHFMFAPGVEGWPSAGCPGCSFFVDQIGHLAHLHARDTSFALVSRAPLARIEPYKERMGWTVPWFSSAGSDFNVDFGLTRDDGETFGLSVFVRDGDTAFRTYFTAGRGVEALGSTWTFLDLTPLGRQELWEDSPPGWPRTPPYEWWRRYDEYENAAPYRST